MTPAEKVESLFGDNAFLVPCEWGTKKPLVTYVERPFEATKTEAYWRYIIPLFAGYAVKAAGCNEVVGHLFARSIP